MYVYMYTGLSRGPIRDPEREFPHTNLSPVEKEPPPAAMHNGLSLNGVPDQPGGSAIIDRLQAWSSGKSIHCRVDFAFRRGPSSGGRHKHIPVGSIAFAPRKGMLCVASRPALTLPPYAPRRRPPTKGYSCRCAWPGNEGVPPSARLKARLQYERERTAACPPEERANCPQARPKHGR